MTLAITQIKAVLNDYLIGMTKKDINRIKKIFVPESQMFFIRDEKLIQIPIFPGLLQFIDSSPEDPNCETKILVVDVTINAAFGKVEVRSNGLIYTDFFTLLFIDGNWKIVNKTFCIAKQIDNQNF